MSDLKNKVIAFIDISNRIGGAAFFGMIIGAQFGVEWKIAYPMIQEAQATYISEQLYTVDITGKEARCVPTDSENGVSATECEALALKAMRGKR